MTILEITLSIIDILQFLILVYLYTLNRKKIKLSKYIRNLPAKLEKTSFRPCELDLTRNIKSAASNYGFRVSLIKGEKNKFEIIENFNRIQI